MEVLAFLVWLLGSSPTPPLDYYNCLTDADCQAACEERGDTYCDD